MFGSSGSRHRLPPAVVVSSNERSKYGDTCHYYPMFGSSGSRHWLSPDVAITYTDNDCSNIRPSADYYDPMFGPFGIRYWLSRVVISCGHLESTIVNPDYIAVFGTFGFGHWLPGFIVDTHSDFECDAFESARDDVMCRAVFYHRPAPYLGVTVPDQWITSDYAIDFVIPPAITGFYEWAASHNTISRSFCLQYRGWRTYMSYEYPCDHHELSCDKLPNVTSLLLNTPTPTSTPHVSNPDQPETTISFTSAASTAAPSAAPLPSGLPSVILPDPQLNLSLVPTDYTLINVLFNNSLNWEWEATNADSPGQIFVYFPGVIATALDIEASQVMNYDLVVYIPSTYTGPQDVAELGTIWQGYIPSDMVTTLASLISNQKSVFYTGQDEAISSELAACVDPSLALDAITGPAPGGDSNTSSSSTGSDTRRDAVIGVVSSLGALALVIVAYVGYRTFKRHREAAHHRLSDVVGVRPEGQEFDRDSVGEQRRRSFYYAEDSLRGYQGAHPEDDTYDHHASQMRERRHVVPAAISTPILRESTMNW
ncbi:hypothetical protein ID866_5362 [Astraeus odoratus]|nr:hypothetical protein ID866_5362 [Astraeus odoratus]